MKKPFLVFCCCSIGAIASLASLRAQEKNLFSSSAAEADSTSIPASSPLMVFPIGEAPDANRKLTPEEQAAENRQSLDEGSMAVSPPGDFLQDSWMSSITRVEQPSIDPADQGIRKIEDDACNYIRDKFTIQVAISEFERLRELKSKYNALKANQEEMYSHSSEWNLKTKSALENNDAAYKKALEAENTAHHAKEDLLESDVKKKAVAYEAAKESWQLLIRTYEGALKCIDEFNQKKLEPLRAKAERSRESARDWAAVSKLEKLIHDQKEAISLDILEAKAHRLYWQAHLFWLDSKKIELGFFQRIEKEEELQVKQLLNLEEEETKHELTSEEVFQLLASWQKTETTFKEAISCAKEYGILETATSWKKDLDDVTTKIQELEDLGSGSNLKPHDIFYKATAKAANELNKSSKEIARASLGIAKISLSAELNNARKNWTYALQKYPIDEHEKNINEATACAVVASSSAAAALASLTSATPALIMHTNFKREKGSSAQQIDTQFFKRDNKNIELAQKLVPPLHIFTTLSTAYSAAGASKAAAIQTLYHVKRAYDNFDKDSNWKGWSVSTEREEWRNDFKNAIRVASKAIETAQKAEEATMKAREAAIAYIRSLQN